jgi:hypothetical protein
VVGEGCVFAVVSSHIHVRHSERTLRSCQIAVIYTQRVPHARGQSEERIIGGESRTVNRESGHFIHVLQAMFNLTNGTNNQLGNTTLIDEKL